MWGWGLAAGRMSLSELSVMGGSWRGHRQSFEVECGKLPQGLRGGLSWEHSLELCVLPDLVRLLDFWVRL